MRKLGYLAAVALSVFVVGCVRVARPPEDIGYTDIPAYAWETLLRQTSFDFSYSVSRSSIQFSIEGSGTVVLPDAIRFRGTWKLGDEERRLDLAAAGGYQLEKADGEWLPHQRSEESKIVEEVDRVIRKALMRRQGKGFELVSDEGNILTYNFIPNLAYLDLGFEKKFDAQLVVDGRTLLARGITASSDDEDVHFEFAVSGINRARKIDLPFSSNFKVSYNLIEGWPFKIRSVLRHRYQALGRESRVRIRRGVVEVSLALPVEEQVAKVLSEPGKLVILGLNLEGEEPKINTRGEISDIFHIADTVARPLINSLEVGFDSLSRPVLEFGLSRSEPSSRVFDYLGIVVDGVLYEVLPIDNPTDFIKIGNVTTYQDALALATKLRTPLKSRVVYRSQEKLR